MQNLCMLLLKISFVGQSWSLISFLPIGNEIGTETKSMCLETFSDLTLLQPPGLWATDLIHWKGV